MGSKGLAITPRTPSSSKRRRSADCTFAVRKITGMSRVASSVRRAARVDGPSMSGIITSSRMASGRTSRAAARPRRPESAAAISQPPVSSSASVATSRMSSSSSITNKRLCGTDTLLFTDHGLEQMDHSLLELLERGAALRQELRRSEAQPLLLRLIDVDGGIDDERRVAERAVAFQAIDDCEAVHFRQAQVKHDEIGAFRNDRVDRSASVRRMDDATARLVEGRREDTRQIEIVFHHEDGGPLAGSRNGLRQLGGIAWLLCPDSVGNPERKGDLEDTSLPFDALGPDASPVGVHDAAADCQTEARAPFLPRIGRVDLLEALEDRLQLVRRNPSPLVGNNERQRLPVAT